MSGDTVLIQDAMGEKVGKFIQLISTFIGGFVIAFAKGWILTLAMLTSIPPPVAAGRVMAVFISKMASRGQNAYAKAATVVEQTIGSIRTVCQLTIGSMRVSKNLSLPYLYAYLDSLGTNFRHGANFAVAASTITPQENILPQGGFSPFYLEVQYWQFSEFKNKSQIVRERGGIYKDLMPKEEYFSKALYTIDVGGNDLGAGFFGNMSIEEVNASVPDIVNTFSTNFQALYNLGARSFWIHNTGPIGCLPYILALLPIIETDSVGCPKPYNEVAQYFNQKLKEAVVQLRNDYPLAAITYVDIYTVKYALIKEPNKYGLELPLVACCGYGGKYNFSSVGACSETVTVNGTQIFIGSCENPSIRVNWDGVHNTEAQNKYIFDQISTGAFSDPPIPLSMACHRDSQ